MRHPRTFLLARHIPLTRHIPLAGAIPIAVATAALIVTASAPAVAGPPSDRQTPRSELAVSDVSFLGPIDQNPHVAARDNGQSVKYGDQSVWFFDDTITTDPDGFISSTAAITSDLDASDNITLRSADALDETSTGTPPDFVPLSAAETDFQDAHAADDCTGSTDDYCGTVFAHWPGPAVVDHARHRILVSYGKLCRGGRDGTPCESGFVGQALGTGLVAVDMEDKTITRLTAEHRPADIPSPEGTDKTLFFTPDQAWTGNAMVLVGNTLYGYGKCTLDGCAVAKAPIDHIQDISRWRYFTGSNEDGQPIWSTDPDRTVLVKGPGAAGATVYYDDAFGAYVNSYMPWASQDVLYQTAPHPWGPWSTPQKLFTAPKTSGTEYASFAHPEYTSRDGLTKYFTYYTSSTGAQELVRVRFGRG
ncbi:DUF4185 domain-containing protein [Microlunatus soli]|uniref:DUF4185 domain-containing protein n=1 Tax=Microlunatus soli TaxID=630515 RepID=A0A1H1ZN21_9ACTN|nr:DUF4185 domain-containing protein [Microlunatus soli]SDT35080.1 protein of unknown function [Microlunatus soli]